MTAASPAPANRWLFGAGPDLLLGCGGAYALLVAGLLFFGAELRAAQPLVLFPLLALAIGTPHYGATLLRVYERRVDRRRYVVFSLWATLVVAAIFVGGLYVPAIGLFLVTLYLTWSPWHYTGQNYGIAVMFLRRNGVAISATDKRWLYWSFLLSFAIVLAIMHASHGDPGQNYAGAALRFHPLGIPPAIVALLVPVLVGASVLTIAVTAVRLLRLASPRVLLPVALLVATQVLWFSLPFVLRHYAVHPRFEPFDWDFRTYYFLWIAMGHSIQYLWVTSYFARQTSHWSGHASWYAKVLAAGGGAWMLPAVLFGPLGFGALSMDQGLALLVASAVNVHHFVLDGAIWKLRGRLAEILIRDATDVPDATAPPWRARGLRGLVWAAGAFGAFLFGYQVLHQDLVRREERSGDLAGAQSAWQRLGWFGLDEAQGRVELARMLLTKGDTLAAREEFQRSLALSPLAAGWYGLAETHAREGEWLEAAEACERGLQVAPRNLELLGAGAFAWRQAGQPERALPLIERALFLDPDSALLRSEHERVVAASAQGDRGP